MKHHRLVEMSTEVAGAVAAGRPVVAFETTILSFGLPSPTNIEVAAECEAAARAEGCVPATAAILNGRIRLGLTDEEIAFFCTRDLRIRKVNLQNFAACVNDGAPGALTVAASVRACALAGVKVFATGGIGGVHRGWSRGGNSGALDVSSDLTALARDPVAVVCAGAKSILDVSATLEALETLGVPVVGFGAQSFPLFFARESQHPLDINFAEIEPLANFVRLHFELLAGGVLVANPPPAETALARADLDSWITQALADAERESISGKRVTPYLLSRLEALSSGKTLAANRALVVNNAKVAARLARALAGKSTGTDTHSVRPVGFVQP